MKKSAHPGPLLHKATPCCRGLLMDKTLHHLGAYDGTTSLWNHKPPHRLSGGQHAPLSPPRSMLGGRAATPDSRPFFWITVCSAPTPSVSDPISAPMLNTEGAGGWSDQLRCCCLGSRRLRYGGAKCFPSTVKILLVQVNSLLFVWKLACAFASCVLAQSCTGHIVFRPSGPEPCQALA